MHQELLRTQLNRLANSVINRDFYFDPYSAEGMYLEVIQAVGRVQSFYSDELPWVAESLARDLSSVLDLYYAAQVEDSNIETFLIRSIRELQNFQGDLTIRRAGWENENVSSATLAVPSMLSPEVIKYYRWLARTYKGEGVFVDVGSWMGGSTCCLAEGLLENPVCKSERVVAIDSFIWYDWMKQYSPSNAGFVQQLNNRQSFLDHFIANICRFGEKIEVRECVVKIDYDDMGLPLLSWDSEPIGIILFDFSDDYETNLSLWEIFSKAFIRGSTIIVFNQYGNAGASEVREFCADHEEHLQPLHKPKGSAKAFLYK